MLNSTYSTVTIRQDTTRHVMTDMSFRLLLKSIPYSCQILFSNRFILLSRIKSLIRQLNFKVDIMYKTERMRGGVIEGGVELS